MATQILSIRIEEPDLLQRSYMPFLTHGGLYLELPKSDSGTPQEKFQLDASVCLLLQLYDSSERFLSMCKVVWIGPKQFKHQAYAFGLGLSAGDSTLQSMLEARLRDLAPLQETGLTL